MPDGQQNSGLRLHIGCGSNVRPGWVNIDREARVPGVVTDVVPTALPYPDGTVSAIVAEHVFEHFSFSEERDVWQEMSRVLRPGGSLTIEVPDFEWICRKFLEAEDDWRDFYRVGHPDHYAGCGRALDQRWGILQTMFFGNQNGSGQFHRSAYTEGKLRSLGSRLKFSEISITRLCNKGGQALRAEFVR